MTIAFWLMFVKVCVCMRVFQWANECYEWINAKRAFRIVSLWAIVLAHSGSYYAYIPYIRCTFHSIPFHSGTNEQEHINYIMLFKMHARARPDYTSLCAGISIKCIYICIYICYDDAESWWKPNWIFPVWHLIKSKRNSHIKRFQSPQHIIITHKTTKTMLMILSLPLLIPLLFAALALHSLLIVSHWRWTESRQQTEIVKCYTHTFPRTLDAIDQYNLCIHVN